MENMAQIKDLLDHIEDRLAGLSVAVFVAHAEPDSIISENMILYLRLVAEEVYKLIYECEQVKALLNKSEA